MKHEVVVLVCDHCGTEDGVQTYEIRRPRERVARKVDLCERGAAPMEKILGKVGTAPRVEKRTSSRPSRRKVTSIEEIEAKKKTKKKS